ncbi:MAG TPA: RluA family pseudouridine synthase [Albitalea sp.]|nr:RluA family pseudouridine synthase [Albitalea sp.]
MFCDASLLALDKPAGTLAVPGRGAHKQDCLATQAQAVFADALVVHRLDMATSGLMLMARGLDTQRRLSRAFARREVRKRYVAVVSGRVPMSSGAIELPLAADWPNRPMQKVDAEHGKPSLTHYRVLAYDALTDTTRLALEPVTGRSHQLRVHLLALGHPIVGDGLYAPGASGRLMLHASELNLAHPATGEALHLTSEPPF